MVTGDSRISDPLPAEQGSELPENGLPVGSKRASSVRTVFSRSKHSPVLLI